jgi:hypothetical protein
MGNEPLVSPIFVQNNNCKILGGKVKKPQGGKGGGGGGIKKI